MGSKIVSDALIENIHDELNLTLNNVNMLDNRA